MAPAQPHTMAGPGTWVRGGCSDCNVCSGCSVCSVSPLSALLKTVSLSEGRGRARETRPAMLSSQLQ